MKMNDFSNLYQKLVFTIAFNFFGNPEEAQTIVQETYLKWSARGNAAYEHSDMSPIRIAANLCMQKGNNQV